MIEIFNDTPRYNNQYYDVKNIRELDGDEATRTCNITCVSMITNEDPNDVLQKFFKKYGYNNKFQWEELLIDYLKENNHECIPITKTAWPDTREIEDNELKQMLVELKNGNIIFYHKYGHYQLMVGFTAEDENTVINDINFIFNDPAGDRKIPTYNRKKESGHKVIYPYSMVKAEKIYGKCWSITL